MALIDILKDKHGPDFHPALILADVAADKKEDTKLRVECAKTLLPYIEASKKSVEVRADINQNVGLLRVNLFEEEIDEDTKELSTSPPNALLLHDEE